MYFAGLFLTILLVLAYCWLILQYRKWFCRLQPFKPDGNISPLTSFSIIIPARNEAAGIADVIRTILNSSYPPALIELIVVNDHSTDTTVEIVQQLQQEYSNLQLFTSKHTSTATR